MRSEEKFAFVGKHYAEMYEKMVKYANCTLKNHHLSEEAVQEVFRITCEDNNIDKFCNSPNPSGWLMETLKYVIRNIDRNRQTLNKYFILAQDLDSLQIETLDEISLEALYGDVSKRDDFKLVKRIVLDRYTMAEAAQELGISLDTCRKRVQRAIKALRKIIEEEKFN
jgi:RNA polymerase sigma-70 factor (ECF subfamily)